MQGAVPCNDVVLADMPPTAEATPMGTSLSSGSRLLRAPAGAKEGDMLEIDDLRVRIPAGVQPGDMFLVPEPAPVVATPVDMGPTDQELARDIQRSELTSQLMLEAYGGGHPHLSPTEQRLLNYRRSIKCFSLFDMFGTLLLSIDGKFGHFPILFLVGPILGYWGASRLQHSKVTLYVVFCLLKTFYVALLVVIGYYLAVFVLIIQLWVDNVVYKFWRLLTLHPPSRIAQLNDPAYNAHLHQFLYY